MTPNNILRHYRRAGFILDEHDLAMADRIADTLARAGAPRPDRKTVFRLAVEALIYELRGKSEEEIAQFFAERERARREASTYRVH